MKRTPRLEKTENQLRNSIESGDWDLVSSDDEAKKLVKAAKKHVASQRKEAKINLRLNEGDVLRIREKASQLGLPYQTYMASILHQFATDQLVPRSPLEKSIRKVVKQELRKKVS